MWHNGCDAKTSEVGGLMPRFRPVQAVAALTAALLVLYPVSAGAAPAGVSKSAPEAFTRLPLTQFGAVTPSGVTAAAESEPNNNPLQADAIANGEHTGSINADTDYDDVYAIALLPGDELEVRLAHNWSVDNGYADVDLYLLAPGTNEDFEGLVPDQSENGGINAEFMRYKVPPGGGGTYYIDVCAWYSESSLTYWLDVSVNDAADISGVKRLFGSSRYDTAVDTSLRTFPAGGCDTVVLATGANFPDALSASGLAGIYNGPLLLTQRDTVPASVLDELERLGAGTVVIVGGTGAVSLGVENYLKFLGYTVTRISGDTRYETAALVANTVLDFSGSDTAFVVRGDSYPDALAAAPFSYANGIPILLTPPSYLVAETQDVIEAYGIQNVIIAGGASAVSYDTEDEIAALNGGTVLTDRAEGTSRYQTASMLADGLVNNYGYNSFEMVGVATGRSFPDALAGGAAMGYEGGVLLLSPGDVLDPTAKTVIQANTLPGDDAAAFGGEGVIETQGTLLHIWQAMP